MKIKKLFLLILLLASSFILFSCKKNETVLLKSIKIYPELVKFEDDYIIQFDYYVYPNNDYDLDIEWSVNDKYSTIDQNGLFKTRKLDGEVIVTCVDKNSSISNEFKVKINRDYYHKTIWIKDRSFNFVSNLDNELLKKFVSKYNYSFIYSFDLIEMIKEKEKDDLEFVNMINELEKSYFSESNLKDKMYILFKLDSMGMINMCDVTSIDIDNYKVNVTIKENHDFNESNNELYYLLELDKSDYLDFDETILDNLDLMYINLKAIGFYDEYKVIDYNSK